MNESPTRFTTNYTFQTGNNRAMGCGFWFGAGILLLGISLFLDSLGFHEFGHILNLYWPTLIIAAGFASLLRSKGSILGPSFVIGLGVLLQLDKLDMLEFGRTLWPIILIIAGLSIVLRRKRLRNYTPDSPMDIGSSSKNDVRDDVIERTSIFSAMELRCISPNFSGGDVKAILGSLEIDLRNADISMSPATLELTAVLGSVELRVPPHWTIDVSGKPFLGNIEDKTAKPADTNVIGPVLRIDATAVLGNVEIYT